MENLPAQPVQKNPVKALFERPEVQAKFKELMGKNASSFVTSVLQIVASNTLLTRADPSSIYHSAAVAATLNLPLNNNLGFAYIVPYNQSFKDEQGKWGKKVVAQFQMGYKGFIQLAQRSGQFKSIYAAAIYKNQIVSENPLEGYEFDFKVQGDVIAGYAAKFKLLNGFEATLFMTIEQLKKHGAKYSQSFSKDNGLWNTDFEVMATKTVIKLLLSKFAPLTIDIQKAVIVDQAIINNTSGDDVTYLDNEPVEVDKEGERIILMINDAQTPAELTAIFNHVKPAQIDIYEAKMAQLKGE